MATGAGIAENYLQIKARVSESEVKSEIEATLGGNEVATTAEKAGSAIGDKYVAAVNKMVSKGMKDVSTSIMSGAGEFVNRGIAKLSELEAASGDSGGTFKDAVQGMNDAVDGLAADVMSGAFPQLKDLFVSVGEFLQKLSPIAKDVGVWIGSVLKDIVAGLKDFLNGLSMGSGERAKFGDDLQGWVKVGADAREAIENMVKTIGDLFGWIGENKDLLSTVAVGIGVFAAAVYVATAAQAAFALVMSVNPLVLIISAVLALVAAIIWFFTQTETGKEIWQNVTEFIGNAVTWLWESVIQPVVDWIVGAWNGLGEAIAALYETYIKPTFDLIGEIFLWIYDNVIAPYIVQMLLGFAVLGAIFTGLWENFVQPIFALIGAVFTWLWETVIMPIIGFIVGAIQGLGAIFTWLYENVVMPIFNAIAAVFQWIYETIILPVVALISAAIQAAGAVFSWLYANAIKPAFDAIGAALSWVWNSIIKPTFDLIVSIVNTVGSTINNVFSGIANFIGNAFQAVLNVVRGPLNALIDLVNGMINGLNSIKVTVPDWIPRIGGQTFGYNIPTIPRLAAGGIVEARPGGILANIGEGRHSEAVVPLDQKFYDALGGQAGPRGNTHITQNITTQQTDPTLQARAWAREASRGMATV